MVLQSHTSGCVWKADFVKSGHIWRFMLQIINIISVASLATSMIRFETTTNQIVILYGFC